MCLVCFHFEAFRFHRLTKQSEMVTNHPIVHTEIHQEKKCQIPIELVSKLYYLPQGM